jgi:hypothetical protein
MGAAARQLAIEKFDVHAVNQTMIKGMSLTHQEIK